MNYLGLVLILFALVALGGRSILGLILPLALIALGVVSIGILLKMISDWTGIPLALAKAGECTEVLRGKHLMPNDPQPGYHYEYSTRYCGAPVVPGGSYCQEHTALHPKVKRETPTPPAPQPPPDPSAEQEREQARQERKKWL
jgi:hypothetical protein